MQYVRCHGKSRRKLVECHSEKHVKTESRFLKFFILLILVKFNIFTIHILRNFTAKKKKYIYLSNLKQVVTVWVNQFYFFCFTCFSLINFSDICNEYILLTWNKWHWKEIFNFISFSYMLPISLTFVQFPLDFAMPLKMYEITSGNGSFRRNTEGAIVSSCIHYTYMYLFDISSSAVTSLGNCWKWFQMRSNHQTESGHEKKKTKQCKLLYHNAIWHKTNNKPWFCLTKMHFLPIFIFWNV